MVSKPTAVSACRVIRHNCWLCFALCDVPTDYPLYANDGKFTGR